MRAIRLFTLAFLVLAAACKDATPTEGDGGEEGSRTGTQDLGAFGDVSTAGPSQALAASANECPRRCALPLREKAGMQAGEEFELLAVNERAEVLGTSYFQPQVWSLRGGFRYLRRPVGQVHAQNNWGQVAGSIRLNEPNGVPGAMAWEPDGTPVVLSERPGGPQLQGEAVSINDNSVIVGTSATLRAFRTHYREGFRWLAGPGSGARDVNYKGEVAGFHTGAAGARRAVVWAPDGSVRELGVLPGYTESEALAINETGMVLGFSGRRPGASRGFVWTAAAGMQPLPEGFHVYDLNRWGEVVGTLGDRCAVYYKEYGMMTLPQSVPGAICVARSINSWGDVAGTELTPKGPYAYANNPVVWTWARDRYRYGF